MIITLGELSDWIAATNLLERRLPLPQTRTRPEAWANWTAAHGLSLAPQRRMYENFYFKLEAATAGLDLAIAPEILVRKDITREGSWLRSV